MTRHQLLKMFGLAGGAAGLRSLLPRRAWAAAAAAPIPTRFVAFFTDHGNRPDLWTPLPAAGNNAPTETAFELAEMHKPLQPYKDKLIFLDGMDFLQCWDPDVTIKGGGHTEGHAYCLTGAHTPDRILSGGISIDQHIAQFLNSPTPVTPIPSLELEIVGGSGGFSFAAPGPAMPRIASPIDAYKRIFPQGNASQDTIKTLAAQRKSVLDLVAGDFASLTPRLSKDDRTKLEIHAQAVRDLESAIQLVRECAPLDLKSLGGPFNAGPQDGIPGDTAATNYLNIFNGVVDGHLRLIQAAFSCDITRVVSIALHDVPNALSGLTPGKVMPGGTTLDNVHGFMHSCSFFGGAEQNKPESQALFISINTQISKVFASLLGHLAAIPEADGQTMLDHTVVLWCGELGDGNHTVGRLPWMMAGSAGGYFKTGRYLKFPRIACTSLNPFNCNNLGAWGQMWPYYAKGRSHNDVLVSVANAMGSPITTFGTPTICTGPITELRG